MKKLIFGLILLVPFLVSAQQVPRSLTAANGQLVGFYEFKPADYNNNPTAKFPLIIFLHGIGERGDGLGGLVNMVGVGIPGYINRGATMNFNGQSFLVLSPQLHFNYGSWQNFYIDEMLNYARNTLRVDPDRIYLTGLSLGGGGTWKYASTSVANASQFAAIAPICGTCDYSNLCNIAQANTAVWAFHAMDDGVVGVGCTQGAVNMLNSCGGPTPPKVTYYPSGNHYIWDMAYDMTHSIQSPQNLFEWFLTKSRSGSVPPPPPPPGNTPPVANAGSDQWITASTANLNGSGSFDQGGSIASFNWTQVSGPGTATMSNSWGANNTVGGLLSGNYVFRLRVTDNGGAVATDDVTVTVNAPGGGGGGGTPPVAAAGNDQTLNLPTNKTLLAGSGSYVPGGGYISNYAWSQVNGPSTAAIQTVSSTNVEAGNLVAGTYTFKLTVSCSSGTNTDEVKVTVNGSTPPPPPPPSGGALPVAVAGSNQTITLPTNSVFLAGSGSYVQGGGYISSYAWSQQSGPNNATLQTISSTNVQATNLIGGTYVFKLTVTSAGGSSSANVTVTVNGGSTPPPPPTTNGQPVAVPGSNQTITLPTNSVFLAGSGSYVQGGGYISSYAWSQQSGPNNATLQTISSTNVQATNLIGGTYVFKLTVTSAGGSSSANVTVTVNGNSTPPPTSGGPIAAAGPDQSIWGTSAFLAGSGSYDNTGGYITNYTWSQVSGPNQANFGWISNTNVDARSLVRGVYVFKLTVTNNRGQVGTDTIQVTVN